MTIDPKKALSSIPTGLRDPLLQEFSRISLNYFEHRWGPSELSGGLFCEIAFSILDGHATGNFPVKPKKPKDFVSACRKLEQNTHVPRSFQILIPRLLPALYEIRNNRGVGHVGGDVDPNPMDASAVLSMTSWIMAEFIRVFHSLDIPAAQKIVDALSERPIPLVWSGDGTKRILDPTIPLKNQILILLSSSPEPVEILTLQSWLSYSNLSYLKKLIGKLDSERLLYLSKKDNNARLLPPGVKVVSKLIENSKIHL